MLPMSFDELSLSRSSTQGTLESHGEPLKKHQAQPSWCCSVVLHQPMNQEVAGSIPGQGAFPGYGINPQ